MWHHGIEAMDHWMTPFGGLFSLIWLVLAIGIGVSFLRGITGKYRKAHRHTIRRHAKGNLHHGE